MHNKFLNKKELMKNYDEYIMSFKRNNFTIPVIYTFFMGENNDK